MARPRYPAPDMSPWKRHALIIPPDSVHAWLRLAVWEGWMGMLLCGATIFGTRLIASASENIVTVFDFSGCYGPPPILRPCERVAYKAGTLNMVFNIWCGVLFIVVAFWLAWELWNAAAPKPITDDFLKLLEDSFSRDWRKPRTWPWTRLAWAYGFALVGVALAAGLNLLAASAGPVSKLSKPPIIHIDTTQRFRAAP